MKKFWSVAILLLVAVPACTTVPITGRRQLDFVPSSQMASMAEDSYRDLLSKSKLSQDAAKVAMVRVIGKRIAASAEDFMRSNGMENEISGFAWEFNLIQDDKTVNAFCMPGGKVAVYTGILPIAKDADSLAVVMGHEVAHAIARHGNERMSQQLLVQLGGTALTLALKEKPEQTRNIFLQAYGVGSSVGVLLPYSREHESEADHIGLLLMARAGYNPSRAIPFWERMDQGGSRPPEFLSTHPAPVSRIESIREFLPEAMPYYEKSKR